jgi:acetate kinase
MWLEALAAAVGGLHTLVFAGGIEESSPEARRTCDGLEFLGIALDDRRNAAGAPLISAPDARVAVRVTPTDEKSMNARSAAELMARPRAATGPSS